MIQGKRGRGFWLGFLVGVAFMLVALVVFWFLGVIDVFPATKDEQNTSNTVVTNEDNDVDEVNDIDNDDEEENDTANEDNDVDQNETNDTDNDVSSEDSVVEGATMTLAKGVDESANPVDPTESFTKDDDKIYVVLELDDPEQFGKNPTLMVEWFKEGEPLSDFEYELPDGQSRVYFYQNNAGAGDYQVTLSAGNAKIGTKSFTVSK